MANMVDYLAWRGEFGFDITPWNEVDALLLSTLCYLTFRDTDDARGCSLAEAKSLGLLEEEEGKSISTRYRKAVCRKGTCPEDRYSYAEEETGRKNS